MIACLGFPNGWTVATAISRGTKRRNPLSAHTEITTKSVTSSIPMGSELPVIAVAESGRPLGAGMNPNSPADWCRWLLSAAGISASVMDAGVVRCAGTRQMAGPDSPAQYRSGSCGVECSLQSPVAESEFDLIGSSPNQSTSRWAGSSAPPFESIQSGRPGRFGVVGGSGGSSRMVRRLTAFDRSGFLVSPGVSASSGTNGNSVLYPIARGMTSETPGVMSTHLPCIPPRGG